MSDRPLILRNVLFSSGSYAVVVVVAIVATPLLVWGLTMEGYGIYVLITSFSGYYGLLDLGFGQGITRFVAHHRARGEHDAVAGAVAAGFMVQGVLGVVASAVLILTARPLLRLLNVPDDMMAEAAGALRLSTVGLLCGSMNGIFLSTFAGVQRFDITGRVDALASVAQNGLAVGAVLAGGGITGAVVASIVTTLGTCIVYVYLARRIVPEVKMRVLPGRGVFASVFRFSVFLFISRLSGVFSSHIVRFLVSAMLSPAAVTLFVVPSRLLAAIGGLLSSAAATLFPSASELGAQGGNVRGFLKRWSRVFATVSIPVLLGMILFSREILGVWMGWQFAERSWTILGVLTISGLCASQSTVPNQVVSGLGNSRLLGLFGVISILLYVVLLPLGTLSAGLIGTALGMLGTSMTVTALVFILTTRAVGLTPMPFLREVFAPHIFPVGVTLALFCATLLFASVSPAVMPIAGGIVLLLYYGLPARKRFWGDLRLALANDPVVPGSPSSSGPAQ